MKKIISILLTAVIAVSSTPISVFQEAAAVQATAAVQETAGESKYPPPLPNSIPISNRADLEAISENLDGNYYLANDIDLQKAPWNPIGTNENPFTGTLDGQGHKIFNLVMLGAHRNAGIFGVGGSDEGGEKAVIKNVGVEGLIDINCSNSGTTHVGGIIGMGDVFISNCFNNVKIVVNNGSRQFTNVGGIIGNGGTVTKCFNSAEINVNAHRIEATIAGICGYGSVITECFNFGNITAWSYESIRAGGIAGASSDIYNSFNRGSIFGNSGRVHTFIGGILGFDGIIDNTYNMGDVSASRNPRVGGIAGRCTEASRSYWNIKSKQIRDGTALSDNDKAGTREGTAVTTPLTTSQMKKQESYEYWDFENTWVILPKANDGYPVLRSAAIFSLYHCPKCNQDLYLGDCSCPLFSAGYVLDKDEITIHDALHILMYLVGMQTSIIFVDTTGRAKAAACITGGAEPTIFDALEILKHLVGMDNEIDNPAKT